MTAKNTPLLDSMIRLYNSKPPFSPADFASVYADDVVFMDPVHRLQGIRALCACLDKQYASLTECTFIPTRQWADGDHLFLQWDLHAAHPQLAGGRRMVVNGFSILQVQDDRIVFHRDIYDLGQMLYEHVPALGYLNRKLKQHVARCAS